MVRISRKLASAALALAPAGNADKAPEAIRTGREEHKKNSSKKEVSRSARAGTNHGIHKECRDSFIV